MSGYRYPRYPAGMIMQGLPPRPNLSRPRAVVRMPHAFNAAVMIPFHALFAALVVAATVRLDKSRYSREGIAGYYRFIWYLFYSEYALLPFI